MQRIKDAKPDALFAFNPAGKQATAMMKTYSDLGLAKDGIKYIGTGDITTDYLRSIEVRRHAKRDSGDDEAPQLDLNLAA